MKVIKAILWYMAGFFIVPFLDLVTPKDETKHWRYLDRYFGNPSSDGIAGDADYRKRVKRFRRIRWYLRNPINAYLRSLGPNGLVQRIKVSHGYFITKVVAWIDNERYWMWDIKLWEKGHLWLGYKLLDDWRPEFNSRLRVLHHFENQMIIFPLKNKPAFQVLPRSTV